MRSTFHGLETARRSLFTHQAALNTTGHNIANANTKGYSRQVVNMSAAKPMEAIGMMRSNIPGQLGTGVEFGSITRIRERFLDDQFINGNQNYSNWQVQRDTLEKLELIMNEPSKDGLLSVVNAFWDAWSDLSKDPENIDGRKIVRETALTLTDAFNTISRQLTDMKVDLTENIAISTSELNTIAETISRLNSEIRRLEGFGNNANDLRDQRDLLVDELSNLVNINVQETDQGYTIAIGDVVLVDGLQSNPITIEDLESAYESGALNGGQIYGMIVSRDVHVANYLTEMDTLANNIANGEITITIPANSVIPEGTELDGVVYDNTNNVLQNDLTVTVNGLNGLHQLGYHFIQPNTAGSEFFVSGGVDEDGQPLPITAGNFSLHPDIVENANLIATSMRVMADGTVVEGNNSLALLMSELKTTRFTFTTSAGDSKATIDDYFRSTVGQLGVQTKEAIRQSNNLLASVQQVDMRRQSVSGVSLDEELTNMMKFQHAYNAAARSVTAIDEMLDQIINRMGVVGR